MIQKYEITDIKHPKFPLLYRIRAIRSFFNVKDGDLGGYVESHNNLSHDGYCWIKDDAIVEEGAHVGGDAVIAENAHIKEKARVVDGSYVCGDAIIFGRARLEHGAYIRGRAYIGGDSIISSS